VALFYTNRFGSRLFEKSGELSQEISIIFEKFPSLATHSGTNKKLCGGGAGTNGEWQASPPAAQELSGAFFAAQQPPSLAFLARHLAT